MHTNIFSGFVEHFFPTAAHICFTPEHFQSANLSVQIKNTGSQLKGLWLLDRRYVKYVSGRVFYLIKAAMLTYSEKFCSHTHSYIYLELPVI